MPLFYYEIGRASKIYSICHTERTPLRSRVAVGAFN